MIHQAYLPHAYVWPGKRVQVAADIRNTVVVPYLAHVLASGVLAYSGYRRKNTAPASDHLCGYALDLVPKAGGTPAGYAQLRAAQAYAKLKRYPYVEFVWQPTNKHLHVSFRRCPKS